jgi:hypothetical protein
VGVARNERSEKDEDDDGREHDDKVLVYEAERSVVVSSCLIPRTALHEGCAEVREDLNAAS